MYGASPDLNLPPLYATQGDIDSAMADAVLRDGTQALTANWDAGSFEVRAQTFQSDVTTGTAPLIVASTTVVTNLNADLLDGVHASVFLLVDGTRALTGDLSAGSNKITNLATPVADGDAANKAYVDSLTAGLRWKESVRAATTAAGTLATDFEDGDTLDGVTLATGDRILIKDQGTASENGIYVVAASGAPARADDLDTGAEAAGAVAFVEEGTANADQAFVCTSDSGSDVVGTDALSFVQFTGGATDHGSLTGLSDDDHTQYLLVSGGRGLSGNWDAGSFEIRAQTFQSDVATGTAPFIVASTTVVANLNADTVDGQHAAAFAAASHNHATSDITSGTFADARIAQSNVTQHQGAIDHGSIAGLSDDDHTQYILANGGRALSANWDAGSFEVRAQTFQSDVGIGTAPLTITSTTVCTNLNADLLDGQHSTGFVLRNGTQGLISNWDAGSHQIRAETFNADVVTGTAPLTITSTTLCTNLNADLLDGNHAAAFATASHTHAASDINSGTLAHERGGLEFNAAAVAIGDIIAGTGTGTMALVTASGKTQGDVLTLQSGGTVAYESPPLTNAICNGRLTTESGVPLSASDRTSQSTIYFTPFKGNRIALYNGTVWKVHTFTERSLALSSLTSGKNYDVFLYNNSGTLTLELSAAWTSDTARSDAVTLQDGVYVKSGATTRRYLGTIRTTSTTATEDSGAKRFVWNLYNQVERSVTQSAAGSEATYSTAITWRAAGGDNNVRCQVVAGLAGYPISLISHNNFVAASGQAARSAIAEDSTTSPSAHFIDGRNHNGGLTENTPIYSGGTADVPLGYHYYQLIEQQDLASPTTTWKEGQLRGDWLC